jgi:hypothetical protein
MIYFVDMKTDDDVNELVTSKAVRDYYSSNKSSLEEIFMSYNDFVGRAIYHMHLIKGFDCMYFNDVEWIPDLLRINNLILRSIDLAAHASITVNLAHPKTQRVLNPLIDYMIDGLLEKRILI